YTLASKIIGHGPVGGAVYCTRHSLLGGVFTMVTDAVPSFLTPIVLFTVSTLVMVSHGVALSVLLTTPSTTTASRAFATSQMRPRQNTSTASVFPTAITLFPGHRSVYAVDP